MHTTNYQNAFIEVAEDCPVNSAAVPPEKITDKTIANIQFEMMVEHPYQFTSDEVIFRGYALKNQLVNNLEQEREQFFSKGQACLRTSPLAKRYGWGIHHDADGKVALYPMESDEYQAFVKDSSVKKVKAMRSKRN